MKITALALAYIVGILVVMNITAFVTYGIDKSRAKRGDWRVSEKTLILLSLFGGSIGALCGMRVFRHKTLHPKFKYGLPAILLLHIAIIVLIFLLGFSGYIIFDPHFYV